MSVPGHIVGMIIGRGGENVKRLQMETGARIQFPIGRGWRPGAPASWPKH